MRAMFLAFLLALLIPFALPAVSAPKKEPKAAASSKVVGFKPGEPKKIEAYLRKTFASQRIRVAERPKEDDSAEVYIGDEFIGVIFVDDDDGDRAFQFQMAILDADLE